jgi:hypothetical protein
MSAFSGYALEPTTTEAASLFRSYAEANKSDDNDRPYGGIRQDSCKEDAQEIDNNRRAERDLYTNPTTRQPCVGKGRATCTAGYGRFPMLHQLESIMTRGVGQNSVTGCPGGEVRLYPTGLQKSGIDRSLDKDASLDTQPSQAVPRTAANISETEMARPQLPNQPPQALPAWASFYAFKEARGEEKKFSIATKGYPTCEEMAKIAGDKYGSRSS